MLPNFLIIGAEKAATTWLARCLAEHPSIYMPRQKEIFFFSSRFERGLPWYEAYFRHWSGQALVGEATPVYLSHPQAPERIRATLGEIRLVVSLRQPVDRAYSAYWHNLRLGRFPPNSDFYKSFLADEWEIRTRGDYLIHLARYLSWFPRDRLLALTFEELRDDASAAFGRCLEFLELNPSFEPRALHSRLNEGGRDLRAFNEPARTVRSRMRKVVLWGMERRLVPSRLGQRIVPVAQRTFDRVAYRWGPLTRRYESLANDVRDELFERYYLAQTRQLEDLLSVDLSRWYA